MFNLKSLICLFSVAGIALVSASCTGLPTNITFTFNLASPSPEPAPSPEHSQSSSPTPCPTPFPTAVETRIASITPTPNPGSYEVDFEKLLAETLSKQDDPSRWMIVTAIGAEKWCISENYSLAVLAHEYTAGRVRFAVAIKVLNSTEEAKREFSAWLESMGGSNSEINIADETVWDNRIRIAQATKVVFRKGNVVVRVFNYGLRKGVDVELHDVAQDLANCIH